jgi:hypothetical protein
MKCIVIVSCLMLLFSCDPGLEVSLSNRSNEQRHVTIIYEASQHGPRRYPYPDSMTVRRQIKKNESWEGYVYFRHEDSTHMICSFDLPANYDAILYRGIGRAFIPTEKIIVNYSDTLRPHDFVFRIAWMFSERKAILR